MKFVQDITQLSTNEEYTFNGYQAPFGVNCIEVVGHYVGVQSVARFDCIKVKHQGVILFLRQDALMYCELGNHVTEMKCA